MEGVLHHPQSFFGTQVTAKLKQYRANFPADRRMVPWLLVWGSYLRHPPWLRDHLLIQQLSSFRVHSLLSPPSQGVSPPPLAWHQCLHCRGGTHTNPSLPTTHRQNMYNPHIALILHFYCGTWAVISAIQSNSILSQQEALVAYSQTQVIQQLHNTPEDRSNAQKNKHISIHQESKSQEDLPAKIFSSEAPGSDFLSEYHYVLRGMDYITSLEY